jgi:hypothetical protein
MKYLLSMVVFLFLCREVKAQTPKDSALAMHMVCFQFSGQVPGGDLAKRYGNNFDVGLSYFYKTRRNFLVGVDPHYFFSKNVKEDVLAPLKTPEGTITNSDGNFSILKLNERGWNITLSAGKIFSGAAAGTKKGKFKLSPNPNSGIMLMLGAGYMQHKIHIFDEERKTPQVAGDYKKGYDRLSAGPVIKEFIGYTYFSNNRLSNFYFGFEFYQGFTKSMRTYDYDLGAADTNVRLDLLYGFRLGWMLPIYKRAESDNLFTY